MTEILFYHLEQKSLAEVLPLLLEKSLERDWKCVVQSGEADNLAALDKALWTYKGESFLPHGMYVLDGANTHPVLLCSGDENPNEAHVRFFVQGAVPNGEGDYQRLVFMFDGHDPEAVSAARVAWKTLSADHQTTYWQQEPSGKWVKKG